MHPTLKRAAGVGVIFCGLLLPCPLIAQQLFSDGAGWYREPGYRSTAAQRHLYWTPDWGSHWEDITPPIPDGYELGEWGQTFFLDRSRGWVTLVPICGFRSGMANRDLHAKLKRAFTADSGKSWTTTDVRLPDYPHPLTLGDGPSCLTFADPKHGWMRIGFADPQGSDDLLLATGDGGRSWELLTDPPSPVGCVRFSSAKDGWMTDTDDGLRVWKTGDGGHTWLKVSPSVPKRLDEVLGDYGIAIRSRKQVSVAALFMSSSGEQAILFVTEDEGRTWKREITLPTWTHDALDIVGSSIIRGELSELSREAPKQTMTLTTFTAKGVSKRQQAEAPSLPERGLPACPTTLSGLNMTDENRGWAYVSCGITDMLFATADAGKSWSNVSPAAVPEMTDYRLGSVGEPTCDK